MWGWNPQPGDQESQAPKMEPARQPEIWVFLWVESEGKIEGLAKAPLIRTVLWKDQYGGA